MAAAKKGGLGKGIDSLIPNKVSATKTEAKNENAKNDKVIEGVLVNINKVEPNREQPRKNFDEDALLELSESIKQFGVLQPLLVQDRKGYYEIIAGERRWRAAKLVNVVCRYIFKANVNFSWSEEVVVALLVLTYMVGAALCSGDEGGLINMTIFTGKMSRRTQLVIEIITNLCLIAFGVIIFISGWDRCASKIASGQVTTALAIPDWIYNAFIPLGAFLMVIHTVERSLDSISELKTVHGADKREGGDAA